MRFALRLLSVNFKINEEDPCVVLIEMTGPIQELTQRNQTQEREQVPFASISQDEKVQYVSLPLVTNLRSG